MDRKGVTILELLISILLISVVILLLLKVMFSLDAINNDKTYASSDEISRTEIIKRIESDFVELKLNGIAIDGNKIIFYYEDISKTLTMNSDKLIYDTETFTLNSENALYSSCASYTYRLLENDYYLININIPVLIDGNNTTTNDDITLTYIGLLNQNSNFQTNYVCSKK